MTLSRHIDDCTKQTSFLSVDDSYRHLGILRKRRSSSNNSRAGLIVAAIVGICHGFAADSAPGTNAPFSREIELVLASVCLEAAGYDRPLGVSRRLAGALLNAWSHCISPHNFIFAEVMKKREYPGQLDLSLPQRIT